MFTDSGSALLKSIEQQVPGSIGTDTTQVITKLTESANAQLSSMRTSAQGVLSSSPSDFLKNIPSASSMFAGVSNSGITAALSSTVNDIAKGTKEAASKLQSFASDSAEAISKPVSYVTKQVSDTIAGVNAQGNGVLPKDLLAGLNSTSLNTIATKVGFNIKASSDLTKAISATTSKLSSNWNSAISSVSKTIAATTKILPITSTPTSFIGSLMGDMKTSVIKSVPQGTSKSKSTDLLSTAISMLSGNKSTNLITSKTNNISSSVSSVLKTMGSSFASISKLIPNGDKLLSQYLNLSSSKATVTYPKYVDKSGNAITAILGKVNDSDEVVKTYKAASTIAPKITIPEYTEYSKDKDLFDMLLVSCADTSMTDLMTQLYLSDESKKYFDSRTVEALNISIVTAAERGDAIVVKTIQDIVGPSKIPNPKALVLSLGSHMADTPENRDLFSEILVGFKLSTSTIINGISIGKYTTYAGPDCAMLLASCRKLVDGNMGNENSQLLINSLVKYA